MANFYVGEVLFETGGTIDTPGDITVTAICDCTGSMGISGQLLSSTGTALEWITTGSAGIPCSILTAKGDMIVASASGTPAALPVGANGRFLVACSTCTDGVGWAVLTRATPTVFGVLKGQTNDSIGLNTALGDNALNTTLTGERNVAVGAYTLFSVTSGAYNTAMGQGSLSTVDSGCDNTAFGFSSLGATTGGCNTAVGSNSAGQLAAGSCNTSLGNNSHTGLLSGCSNVAVGHFSGCNITTGSRNVTIGPSVQAASATGNCQLAIGFSSTDNWLTGDSTKAIKPGAGIIDCANSCGTNGQVLMSNGSNAICWGAVSVPAATPTVAGIVLGCTLVNNTALGCCALQAAPTGCFNTAVGANALTLTGAGNFNVGVGGFAVACNVTGCHNIGLGVNAARNALGSNNTVIGHNALFNATGGCNTVLGFQAGCNITTGGFNVIIGPEAQVASATGSCQLAIGFSLTDNWLTGTSTKAIKPGAGIIDCAGSCGTNGQVLMSNGSNAICWGTASGGASSATPTVEGIVYGCTPDVANNSQPVALGHSAGAVDAGLYNTWIGYTAGGAHTTGDSNHFVGWGAGCALINGNDNVGLGGRAGAAFGSVAGTPTDANVAIGSDALYCTTGSRNIGIGYIAGCTLTTGSQNLLLGFRVQPPSTTGSCQLAIGFSDSTYWLTGDSTKAIKPGAGIIDCAGSCGVVGQVLCSTGSNAVQWATPQTSPFVTYNSAAITYTNGTPVLVAVWDGGTIQGTFSMNLAGYLNLYTYWNVFLSGDATNYNTGWNQTDYWPPTSDPTSQGTWSVNFPVYPDANSGKWEIYFNPTANSANPTVFTFFYRKLSGNDPIWQI